MRDQSVVQKFPSPHPYWNRIGRVLWAFTWLVLFRPSPRPFHTWRRWLLQLFGAQISKEAHPYPSARIWAPWNLIMEEGSCLGDHVDCYSVDRVILDQLVFGSPLREDGCV